MHSVICYQIVDSLLQILNQCIKLRVAHPISTAHRKCGTLRLFGPSLRSGPQAQGPLAGEINLLLSKGDVSGRQGHFVPCSGFHVPLFPAPRPMLHAAM